MKNISLIESSINSNKIWKLINNQGKEFQSFNIFSKLLLKKYSENTRFSYSRSVALFIDYLEEANVVYNDREITKLFLVEIIESFSEWLIYGRNSGNLIAQEISITLKSNEYSSQSAALIMSATRMFLKMSERIRIEQNEINKEQSFPLFFEIPFIKAKIDILRRGLLARLGSFKEAFDMKIPKEPIFECLGLLKDVIKRYNLTQKQVIHMLSEENMTLIKNESLLGIDYDRN